MPSQKRSKLLSELIFPERVLNENAKALEFYRTYKKIADISKKIDTAMGRKQIYKYSSGLTQNCEINPAALPTEKSHKTG